MSKEKRNLYLARFEIPMAGASFRYPEAILRNVQGTVGAWLDFLVGFPIACIELQALVGEISSRKQLVESVQDPSLVSPAFPKTLFGGYESDKILLNVLYLTNDNSDFMAKDIESEPKPKGLHWWLRTNLVFPEGGKFPYPGEFLALAVRLTVDRFSDSQESNPFLYSGNFCDLVYLTSGFIKEVIAPTDDRPWPSYRVTWRKNPADSGSTGEFLMYATDFVEYKIGDRVAILKDVTTIKVSQTWKDTDMVTMGGEKSDPDTLVKSCAIAPLMFYAIDTEKEG